MQKLPEPVCFQSAILNQQCRHGAAPLVESGLETGDNVVLEGLQRMRPGMKVVPKRTPPDGGQE